MKSAARILVVLFALVGAFYCFSGVLMVGSFSVTASPEDLPQYRLRANQWFAATIVFLLLAAWQVVAFWRDRFRRTKVG